MLAVLVARRGQIEHLKSPSPFNAKVLVDNQDSLTKPVRERNSTFVHCKGKTMLREPTPKSQANIVRRVFASHGVGLGHRQALDVVAQLRGHVNWQVMQAQESKPVRAAVKPAKPAPSVVQLTAPVQPATPVAAVSAATVPAARKGNPEPHVFTFEGIAFVETREDFDNLVDDEALAARLWEELKDQAAAFGITGLESVYVSEDDEQSDEDIKVFVGVKFCGRCAWEENERAPYELEDLLERFATAACCDKEGNQLAHPDDWELFDVEDAESA
jgi:hypothetical protein